MKSITPRQVIAIMGGITAISLAFNDSPIAAFFVMLVTIMGVNNSV